MKVGILAGTFDPVHNGHLNFALNSLASKKLDKVIFLPERTPRRKRAVTDYKHRLEMLQIALKPHKKLALLDLPERQFTVEKSLPKIRKKLKNPELYFLFGSDVAIDIAKWPGAEKLGNVIIGLRDRPDDANSLITGTQIRKGNLVNAVPKSVKNYIKKHNLYGQNS